MSISVIVSDDLHIQLPKELNLAAYVRRQDGYFWIELFDVTAADHGDVRLVDDTGVFGDEYAGTGYSPEIVQEKTAALVARFLAVSEPAK